MHYRFAETDEEILACYPVMAELRPHLVKQEFVLGQTATAEGLLSGILGRGGRPPGCRRLSSFRIPAWGRYLYVDDLVSRTSIRSQGYGQALFTWVVEFAKSAGCQALHLDSGVQNFAAHRFYLRNKMNISSHHFRLSLVGG